jgi:hypothetical protein
VTPHSLCRVCERLISPSHFSLGSLLSNTLAMQRHLGNGVLAWLSPAPESRCIRQRQSRALLRIGLVETLPQGIIVDVAIVGLGMDRAPERIAAQVRFRASPVSPLNTSMPMRLRVLSGAV